MRIMGTFRGRPVGDRGPSFGCAPGRTIAVEAGTLDGRFLVVRLGRTGGLLLLMCGASPLAGLFDVAPDRRFGAVGIAGTQRLEDRDVALGNLVQRSMGDGDGQAGG